jgi:predicted dehydrogenase
MEASPVPSGPSARLRVGVLGSGFGGAVHVPAFAAQGRFDVVAIASPNRAEEVARERGVPHAFDTLETLLDGVEVDVVSVATPPYLHRQAVVRSLERGKHVLCEKPFGLNVAECEEMVAAATRAGTVCAVAHEFRYMPSAIAIKELLDNGHLGAPRQIESQFVSTWLRAHEQGRGPGWWFEHRRDGGIAGAILSHLIDRASWLAGRPPKSASGFSRTANPQRQFNGSPFASDVADGSFALIDYGEGLVASVSADATHAVDSMLFAVHGEQRTAVASGKGLIDVTTFLVDKDETAELEIAPAKHANLSSIRPDIPLFVALLDEFANAIDGKPAHYPTFEDALATQRVLEAVGYSTSSNP